jgi:phosphate transport system substrate-binding protein
VGNQFEMALAGAENLMRIRSFSIFAACALSALVIAGTGCGGRDSGNTVSITGSDTMLHLANAWAEAFMNENPDIMINISGGGSGVGIASLMNGTTDFCMSSRDLKEEEQKLAKAQGMSLVEHNVAMDGIAIIVNAGNPIDELTMAQLKDLFTGAYETWEGVGGPAARVIILSRESSSGTFTFFMEHVLDSEDYAPATRLLPSTAAIVESVSQDLGGLGYVGLGYAEGAGEKVKMVAVKADENAPAVYPTVESVRSGEYSIARYLHFYTRENSSPAAQAFLDFCLSDAGQEIVAEIDYVPVK